MSYPVRLLIVACLSSLATSVSAGLMQYRTQVQVSNGTGNGTQIVGAGGLLETFSSLSLSPPSGGALAEASSSLSGGGYIPTLRARAVADSTRAQAVAWGVQGFTNVSTGPLSTSLVMNFTAEVTGGNDVEASVYLFQDEDFEFSIDRGTILFESSSMLWPGFKPFANNLSSTGFDVQRKSFTGTVNESRFFDFTVDPGDSFYVWARLLATADQPGEADAFNTLTASLTNIEGLEPAAVGDIAAVPEPTSLAVFWGMAVLIVSSCFRRVRSARQVETEFTL